MAADAPTTPGALLEAIDSAPLHRARGVRNLAPDLSLAPLLEP